MLGHSMGGHMALRYFQSYADPRFQKLAISAPMLDINIKPALLKAIAPTLARFFVLIGMGDSYVLGGRDWDFDFHSKNAETLSHDANRNMLHRAWYLKNNRLQLGSATFAWLNEAFLSCEHLADSTHLHNIDLPVLMITAGQDAIVDNKTVPHFIENIAAIEHLNIENAYHEIFMESDIYRDVALNKLKEFFVK
jgi:lysophospholipase